jgi:hypothetical protein
MSENPEAFFGWPGWKHLRYALLLSLAGSLWFALVYGGADAFTAHRTFRVRVYFDAELGIPFIPEMALIYMSIYLLFLAAPFILRQRHEFLALAMTLNLVILMSGICFLLFPAQVAFPPPKNFGAFPNLYHFADRFLRHGSGKLARYVCGHGQLPFLLQHFLSTSIMFWM